jgi:hypothetical protein
MAEKMQILHFTNITFLEVSSSIKMVRIHFSVQKVCQKIKMTQKFYT